MNYIEIAKQELGGVKKLADAAKVSQPAVSRWISKKSNPSAKSALLIEKATNGKVTKEQLRPDIWVLERGNDA